RQRGGLAVEIRTKCRDGALRRPAELSAIGDLREAQQVRNRDRVSRGLSAVIRFFDAEHEIRLAAGGAEETAGFAVFKERLLLFGEAHGGFQVAQIELRFVEVEEALREEGVVVEKAGNGGIARSIGAQQHYGFGRVHAAENEIRGGARGGGIARLVENRAGECERRD